jgi:hypothetical protein
MGRARLVCERTWIDVEREVRCHEVVCREPVTHSHRYRRALLRRRRERVLCRGTWRMTGPKRRTPVTPIGAGIDPVRTDRRALKRLSPRAINDTPH